MNAWSDEVRAEIHSATHVLPQSWGKRTFPFYGGFEFPYLEYRLVPPGAILRVVFESENVAWLVVYLMDGGVYACEFDISEGVVQIASVATAAILGTLHEERSILHLHDGLRVLLDAVDWYMEPLAGEGR